MPPTPASYDVERLAIAAALRELERELATFVQALAHQGGPAHAEDARTEREALRRICTAYATLDYADDDPAQGSPVCLGLIGGTTSILDRAESVNAAKAALRAECSLMQNRRVRVSVKDGQGGRVVKSLPLVRVILRELQRSDLNLFAAYRKIPILTGRVSRVAWTRARTRAVYRKTRAEILALIEASDRLSADEDRERVLRLPPRETHLALVKEHYVNVRANVTFHGLDARNRGRTQLSAELPLVYPPGRSKDLPEIHYPPPEGEGNAAQEGTPTRQPRTGKLEEHAFLTTLPIYRYRQNAARRRR